MNPELAELVALYGQLQDCAPQEQADRRDEFARRVKEAAAAKQIDHWRVSAYVQREWEKAALAEERRKGLTKGAGL